MIMIKDFIVSGVNPACADAGFRSALPHGQRAPDVVVDGELYLHKDNQRHRALYIQYVIKDVHAYSVITCF